jgi:hypothetical protein
MDSLVKDCSTCRYDTTFGCGREPTGKCGAHLRIQWEGGPATNGYYVVMLKNNEYYYAYDEFDSKGNGIYWTRHLDMAKHFNRAEAEIIVESLRLVKLCKIAYIEKTSPSIHIYDCSN